MMYVLLELKCKKVKQLLCLIALSLCMIMNSQAQNNLTKISATTGAACYDIHYHNGYLYAGAGNTLLVYGLTTNGYPSSKIFEYRFSSNIDDIKTKGNKLFVAANHAGISMWDISNVNSIQMLDEYVPDSLNEAAYNIAFYGDSIFVAYKAKLAVFKDNGTSLTLLRKILWQTGTSKVRAVAAKDNLLAVCTAYGSNAQTGLYLYNAASLARLSFTQQNFCDPEGLAFGSNNTLHVAGGTESLGSFGLNANGLFYSMDITNPASPVELFRDTLPGIPGLAISMPMNIDMHNDTVFLATESALDANFQTGDTLSGQVYIYDATNKNNIHLINSVNAGLWHFDVAVNNNRMYVASEWYGILTLDISDIMNEVLMGKTLTGGWNLGSDIKGDRMVVGNEGFGLKLFDISNAWDPQLLAVNNSIGFCMNTDFAQTSNYIFGWYWTDDDFRVFDPNTLQTVKTLSIFTGGIADYRRTQVWNNYAIAMQVNGNNRNIIVVDATNPLNPYVKNTLSMNNLLDIYVSDGGKLFAATKDSLSVLDLANNLSVLKTINVPGIFNDFVAVTEYKDTVWAYISGLNGGMFKYYYNGSNQLTQLNNYAHPIVNYAPRHVAVDSFGVYLSYVEQGLYSYNKSMVQKGYYRHAMEFVHNFLWGPQDLVCKDGMILLVEYFGQTTMLTADPGFVNTIKPENQFTKRNKDVKLYPNPSDGHFRIAGNTIPEAIEVYNMMGEKVYTLVNSGSAQIDLSHLAEGSYMIKIKTGEKVQNGKIVICK